MPNKLPLPDQVAQPTQIQVLCNNIQARQDSTLLSIQQYLTNTLNDLGGYGLALFYQKAGTNGSKLVKEFTDWATFLASKAPDLITPQIANAVSLLTVDQNTGIVTVNN